MNTKDKTTGADYSANLIDAATTGKGAGALGVEAMTIAEFLARGEQATTPLLAACQVEQDKRIVERSAYKLRARMQGDGKIIPDDAFKEAQAAAFHAIALWRAGLTIKRDNGEDVLTAATGERESHVARVAWRGLVAFLSNDGLGSSIQIHGGAEDDWLCAQMLPSESRTERAARYWIERHARGRQELLSRRMSHVSSGRGRRAQAVEKVGNALALMLGGESLDNAAELAGFRRRGRNASGDSLLRAAKRLGLISDGFSVPRRGH